MVFILFQLWIYIFLRSKEYNLSERFKNLKLYKYQIFPYLKGRGDRHIREKKRIIKIFFFLFFIKIFFTSKGNSLRFAIRCQREWFHTKPNLLSSNYWRVFTAIRFLLYIPSSTRSPLLCTNKRAFIANWSRSRASVIYHLPLKISSIVHKGAGFSIKPTKERVPTIERNYERAIFIFFENKIFTLWFLLCLHQSPLLHTKTRAFLSSSLRRRLISSHGFLLIFSQYISCR